MCEADDVISGRVLIPYCVHCKRKGPIKCVGCSIWPRKSRTLFALVVQATTSMFHALSRLAGNFQLVKTSLALHRGRCVEDGRIVPIKRAWRQADTLVNWFLSRVSLDSPRACEIAWLKATQPRSFAGVQNMPPPSSLSRYLTFASHCLFSERNWSAAAENIVVSRGLKEMRW